MYKTNHIKGDYSKIHQVNITKLRLKCDTNNKLLLYKSNMDKRFSES